MTMITAPTLDNTYSPSLPPISGESTDPAGISVADLLVDGSISYNIDNGVEAIAVTALDTSLGNWQYSIDDGASWLTIDAGLINSVTNELALLLGPTAQLRLLPFGELSGELSAAITFRAWDMSEGAQGDYTVIESTGDTSPFSEASDTASASVLDVDQSPVFTPTSLTGAMLEAMNEGSGFEFANGVTVQPDGKILVAGFTVDPDLGPVVGLMRLHPDGFLDTTFGADGKLRLPLAFSQSQSEFLGGQSNVLVQADGKIVVAGAGGDDSFLIMRLNGDGSVDASFGDGGTATLSGGDAGAKQVLLQADGKIVLVEAQGSDYAVWRVNADGSADTAFGVDGEVLAAQAGVPMTATSAVLQSDGKLILSGFTDDSDDRFSLLRLNADGSVDTGFATAGRLDLQVGDGGLGDRAACVTVQADGKIVVAGASAGVDNGEQLSVVRLTAAGELDTSFGTDGKFLLPQVDDHNFQEIALSVLVQPDGKIVLAHFGADNGDQHVGFGVVRLSAAGELDSDFGGAGRFVSSLGLTSLATSVALQPNGQIVVAGLSVDFGAGGSPTLGYGVQRVNADGSADADFGGHVLGGTISYTRHAAPVALDTEVAIYDAELAALADGAGDYAGASLTLARHGGAAAEDQFSATGELVLNDSGKALLGAVEVGSYTNAGGTLAITFNDNATQVLVDAVLSSLAYANSSDRPPASAQIDWTFSDGNTGTQGEGGARSSVGHVTVNTELIAPTLSAFSDVVDKTTAGRQVEITFADLAAKGNEADQDGSVVGFVVTQLSGGTLKIGTSAATAVAWADLSRIGSDLNARPVIDGLIDATHHAYWTPEKGVTGNAVDAFKVVALDDTAYVSQGAVQVTVAVAKAPAPAPAPEPTPIPTPIPVDDHDNVPNAVEDAVPGLPATPGGSAVAGDGNGDGVADSGQAAVTSVSILHSDSAASNPGSAPAAYVTLAAQTQGGGVDNGVQIGTFAQQDAPAQRPAHMEMPLGLFDFSATLAAPAASQNFSLIVDASLGANGYWVQSDGVWVNLASAAYGGQIVALEGGKTRLDFKLTDGGAFDTDHAANGSVDNVGAIGSMPLTLVGFAPPAPQAGGHWF
jgi:uncharacterized delta-60 repeat protein